MWFCFGQALYTYLVHLQAQRLQRCDTVHAPLPLTAKDMAAPTSARASTSGLSAAGDASHVELPGFRAEGCNVHVRIPPCDTLGHRADSWNVKKPDYTCELRTLTRGDTFILRLLTAQDTDAAGAPVQMAEASCSLRRYGSQIDQ